MLLVLDFQLDDVKYDGIHRHQSHEERKVLCERAEVRTRFAFGGQVCELAGKELHRAGVAHKVTCSGTRHGVTDGVPAVDGSLQVQTTATRWSAGAQAGCGATRRDRDPRSVAD